MSHADAKLTEAGRLLIIQRLEEGWTHAEVAEAQGISRSTVARWAKRYREEGLEGLNELKSRAGRLPHALGEEVIEAALRLRREPGAGPHRIAYEPGMAASTVYGILRRKGVSVLAHLDCTTRSVIRYERGQPGELVHVAIDDHSRFACVEVLPDKQGATTAGFLIRMVQAFAQVGVRVQRVLSDNGGNYRSFACQGVASEPGVGLRHTRTFRPRTNGKAEAFIKTLLRDWAYRRPYDSNGERVKALVPFLVNYNYVPPHTAIDNQPPASRL